ncbi:MAG TPA: ABC transporter ATP-binding protein [Planctomycetes bacterium]|nr:ABC transporter ATP-binding protein [Planctomycetaceae bacterium]HIN94458.1 ABC transporter ATP-binding protein [Planctomycetota bacterium]
MIQLSNVSKHFQRSDQTVRALDNLTLSIDQGEFVAIRGASGCGKSTLLSLIGGLALPTSGTVSVLEQEISSMNSADRANFRATHVGFVFQMFHLLPYLSVMENVLVAARPTHQEEDQQKATELLEQFSLQDRLWHRPAQLSAGERQRVAMARALLAQPGLLLADEPTGNLDPGNSVTVLKLMQQFHEQGGTILLVTHDEQAAGFADRSIVLEAGQLVPDSSAAEAH